MITTGPAKGTATPIIPAEHPLATTSIPPGPHDDNPQERGQKTKKRTFLFMHVLLRIKTHPCTPSAPTNEQIGPPPKTPNLGGQPPEVGR